MSAPPPGLTAAVRPHFVDNRNGSTLEAALRGYLQSLRRSAGPVSVDVATAFFNLPGFDLLAEEFARVERLRLLLGAAPRPEPQWPEPQPGEPPEAALRRLVDESLRELDAGLHRGRDLLPFDRETDAAIRRLLELLRSGRVEVRRYSRGFLHAKAFLFRAPGGGLVTGSSNLTYAGLRQNVELNLGHFETPAVPRVEAWFDELWAAAEPFDLAAVYDRLMAEFPPWLIYLRVLDALYGEELGQEQREQGEIPLTTFQEHGVWRARRILEKCGGVLVADGVGLGKTFLAGALISEYRARRQRVLLLCPAALRDSTWREFLHRFQLFVECVSYEELANDAQLGGTQRHLHASLEEFALVVVDEAHNYRNPDAPARAQVLRRLLLGPRRDLLLLTATPVNNSLWDLYHLLRYFVKQDARFADRGVLSLRERFAEAMRQDPFNLNPDTLYPVIDATTVKRTRQFIKKHYANDLITLPDGRRVPIQFPKPVASTIRYHLDGVLPGFVAELEEKLVPDEDGRVVLTLARYQPENYRAGAASAPGDTAIVGLLRSGLLKRFESSVHAFARTLERMVREHDLFLEGLDRGVILRKELLRELSAAEDEETLVEELLESGGEVEPAAGYDVAALRRDVTADRALLAQWQQRAASVSADADPKLAALVEELARIARQAREEAASDEDERQRRKVLVFSAYEDTINWIEAFLDRALDKDRRLAAFHGRMASVAGGESRRGVSRSEAVEGFAPKSVGVRPEPEDRFDLLLSTDVLAEGFNLQQCRNIINYDLPWNPMRLVQRHGRVDRIGSPHPRVFLRTFFPDDQLDALLNLEARVRRKLAQAAASVGVEVSPIEGGREGHQTFAETREEIEKLARNDPGIYERGGTESAAQTGEEYRQELRRALLQRGEEIRQLPWKAGSGMAKGRERGHFFCAQVGRRVYLRFVPLAGGPLVREIATCLRLIECDEATPRVLPDELRQTAFDAWQRARQDIFESWTFETDPANLQPKVPRLNREIAAHLRQYPPPDQPQDRLVRALEAFEAPCSLREQKALRAVFEPACPDPATRSRALVEEIERLGLEPYHPPDPLPPIRPEDVRLVCWMGIEAAPALGGG